MDWPERKAEVMDRDPDANREGSDSEGHQDSRHEHDSDGAEVEVEVDGEAEGEVDAVDTDELTADEELDEAHAEYARYEDGSRGLRHSIVVRCYKMAFRASRDEEYRRDIERKCRPFAGKRCKRLTYAIMRYIIGYSGPKADKDASKYSRGADYLLAKELEPDAAREWIEKHGIVDLATRVAQLNPLKKRRTATSSGISGDDWLEEATETTRCSAPAGVFKYDESVLDALRTNQSGRIEIEFELVETTAGRPVLKILHAGSAEDG